VARFNPKTHALTFFDDQNQPFGITVAGDGAFYLTETLPAALIRFQ
jgi:hypothetical protein